MATKKKQTKPRKPGSGRKPIYADAMVKVTIRIPQYQVDHINKVAKGGGQSAAARIIIDRDIDSYGPEEI